MSGQIEVVERPKAANTPRGQYSAYYAALMTTAQTGQAIRVSLDRKQVNSLRMWFQQKHPTLRVVSRSLPDGFYMWAEQRSIPVIA